jgi:GntR family transcriptional regulator, transcriptional repressor for pyruvate dehydrogenase complex
MSKKKPDEPLFEPIAVPKRNFELIEANIRRQIYNGTLIPGQKLPNEIELARQFNVGRSAVREALKVLELAGLLVVRRGYNGGTFVAPPDFEDASETITLTFHPAETTVDQFMEAALTIEVRAAELATQRASDLEISDLQEMIERAEQSMNVPARYLTAIIDFHAAVTEMSHNNIFILVFSAIRNPLMQELNRLISDQKLRSTFISDQREICHAIAEHKAADARRAMHKHLCHINDRLSMDAGQSSKS